jgi:hypothetical protein
MSETEAKKLYVVKILGAVIGDEDNVITCFERK